MKKKNFLWVEEYRPSKIDDCILPESIKKVFTGFLEQGEIPHLLLSGSAGIGKTTVARALCEELGCSVLEINGSDEGRLIDTLRNKISQFATTKSLTNRGKHKVVIIDEADNTSDTVQLSLRHAMEEYSGNCRFILTCNYPNRIDDALHSRCTTVAFSIRKEDAQNMQVQFFSRLEDILKEKGIEYDRGLLAKVVQRYYPDWRKLIMEVQRYCSTGKLEPVVLADVADIDLSTLVSALKNKDYSTCRRWVVENLNNDSAILFRKLYDEIAVETVMFKKCIPEMVLLIAEYSRDLDTIPDHQINFDAFLIRVMMSCEFK